jgi:hypothetical protein
MKNLSLFLILCSLFIFNSLSGQTRHFNGTWVKAKTTYLFGFDLILKHLDGNRVEGVFVWEVVNYDENSPSSINYYKTKLGKTGKEFVMGSYSPKSKEYLLKGYRKEDPYKIIGLDVYRIKVDQNGDIGGTTKALNSWLGKINGKGVQMEVL